MDDRFVPVSRSRRIGGYFLVGLGTILSCRSAWLAVFYGSSFGVVGWIRFAFWLWLGIVLALVGWWMAVRSRAAGWAAGIVTTALVTMGFVLYLRDVWMERL
jgi:nucleoside permease NupC